MLALPHPELTTGEYAGLLGPCKLNSMRTAWAYAWQCCVASCVAWIASCAGGLRIGEVAYGVVLAWAWMRDMTFYMEHSPNGDSYPMPRFKDKLFSTGSEWYDLVGHSDTERTDHGHIRKVLF